MKASLSHSILATKNLESVINNDLFSLLTRFGKKQEVYQLLDSMRGVSEDVMASFRMKLIKLEHDINTLIEKGET